jgi:Ca2+-binding EF-hand superfamily protein
LPQLSDKEIASIFNRLEKKGLIDLDEFIAYLKKREEQDRKMR